MTGGAEPEVGLGAAFLVVNADDLGYDPEIDRGILESHQGGIVSSASAMVDTPFAPAALAAAPPTLGVGLHAVLDPRLDRGSARAEIERQLARLEELRREPASHLDSHRHVHRAPAILEAMAEVAAPRRLPVRALDPGMRASLRRWGVPVADHFLGDADLRPCWTLERLLAVLPQLPPGTTELMCHPGHPPSSTRTSFGPEREVELLALTDPLAFGILRAAGVHLVRHGAR